MRDRTWTLWCHQSVDLGDQAIVRHAQRVLAAGGDWVVVRVPGTGHKESQRFRLREQGPDWAIPSEPVVLRWDRLTRVVMHTYRRWGRSLPAHPWRPRAAAQCTAALDQVLGQRSHHVAFGLDPGQRQLIDRLVPSLMDPEDVPSVLATFQRWDALDSVLMQSASQVEQHRPRSRPLIAALQALAQHDELGSPTGDQEARLAALRTVTRRLIRHHEHTQALELIALGSAWGPSPESGFAALSAHARTSLASSATPDLVDSARAALLGADHQLDQGDLHQAAELLVIGVGLLMHRDLHAETTQSKLVTSPESFLEPLRSSRAVARLNAPSQLAPTTATDPPLRNGTHRVVVLPGAYPRFASPIIEGLRLEPGLEVTVLHLPRWLGSFKTLSLDPHLVRIRLLASDVDLPADLRDPAELSAEIGVLAPVLESLRAADLVVVDWADKGAVWATLMARPEARIVVRIHGVDALGLWIHALDWGRVDTIVSVSEHQARLVDQVLQHAATGRHHMPSARVVHNVARLSSTGSTVTRDGHLLGLVGWGKLVKDPLWAVEVLAELRRRGGNWRLRLVGPDFSEEPVAASREYMDRFRLRIEQPDVSGVVECVGETPDVAHEVEQMGFILSSSRRESFHLGLVEGVLGGAVPVVRDWPFYSHVGGASTLFPKDWVVTDPVAAADRIWALRGEDDRAKAAAAALAEVRDRFDPDRSQAHLIDVILGRS